MQSLRAFCLALAFFCLTVASIPIQWLSIRLKLPLQKSYPHAYHRFLTRLLGIRVTVIGKPVHDRGVLMVANHSGYFDILVLSSVAPVSFVAKSEVVNWPLFGLMAKLQRSVFVERSRRSFSGVARDMIRKRLVDGDALVLFPEGTTTDGNRVLPFKSSLMGAAETEIGTGPDGQPIHVPVQPVSVAYVGMHGMPMGRENRPYFAWYGDMGLMDHLWEAFKAGPLDVIVEFHPPLTAGPGMGRKQIAVLAEGLVRKGQMRALRGDWGLANEGTEQPVPEPA
jgi:1-acyl-sn-glycerol-3-phosphate acyltransferase